MDFEMKRVPDIRRHPLFDSRFFLITDRNDPLSKKTKVTAADLAGRTLMVGGGSPPVLRAIQNRVVSEGKVTYFNSRDHDTTLTNVAAGRGVCIAPDFLNDHCEEFCWTPFDTAETIPCSLYTHKNEKRKAVKDFIKILQDFYR
ncbi:MAG: LysR family transcriptional regulator substrate-binding protein [Mesosutterella multiformis]|nr:LysR family transcriptional regulator substrate-binding protein [Mesosutterella multiformis]